MLALIDLEHASYSRWDESVARQLSFKDLIEDLSSEQCLLIRHNQVNPHMLNSLGVSGLIVTGNFTDFELYDRADLVGLEAVFDSEMWPMLTICGSFQLLARHYGATIGPMEPASLSLVEKQEPELFDLAERDSVIDIAELGFTKLSTLSASPILANIPDKFIVYEYHYWSVKSAPEGFQNLASSQACEIQLIAHDENPVYGCEFHPEEFTAEYPHGKQILRNFIDIVKSIRSKNEQLPA